MPDGPSQLVRPHVGHLQLDPLCSLAVCVRACRSTCSGRTVPVRERDKRLTPISMKGGLSERRVTVGGSLFRKKTNFLQRFDKGWQRIGPL